MRVWFVIFYKLENGKWVDLGIPGIYTSEEEADKHAAYLESFGYSAHVLSQEVKEVFE